MIILGVDDPEKTKLKGLDRVFGIEENIDNYDAIGREIQKIIPPLSSIWEPDLLKIKEVNKNIALIIYQNLQIVLKQLIEKFLLDWKKATKN